ncbi:MAG: DUF3343 domain-containing protein [Hydrogenoanaerobacterium sp.]
MAQYIATFHTHLAALCTDRTLRAIGVTTQMTPVPRKLSSSCGTCVRYAAEDAHLDKMDTDVESVYSLSASDEYELLYKND